MFIIIWLLCAFAGAMIGKDKGRAGTGFILGLLLGPLGLLIIFLLKGNKKVCPFCKEYINREATRCSKCQKNLGEHVVEKTIKNTEVSTIYLQGFFQRYKLSIWLVIIGVVVTVYILGR